MTARISTPPAGPREITIFVIGGCSTGKTRIIERVSKLQVILPYTSHPPPYWLDQYNTQCCPLLETPTPRVDRTIAGTPCMLTFIEVGFPESWVRDPTEIDRQWENVKVFPHAAMLVYSAKARRSFEALQKIWPAVQRYLDRGKCRVVEVVAEKSDVVGEVNVEEAAAWAEEVGAAFGECSAREGKGVTEVVEKLVLEVLDEMEPEKEIVSLQENIHHLIIPRPARMIKYLRHWICG